jgi:hypothetical protein
MTSFLHNLLCLTDRIAIGLLESPFSQEFMTAYSISIKISIKISEKILEGKALEILELEVSDLRAKLKALPKEQDYLRTIRKKNQKSRPRSLLYTRLVPQEHRSFLDDSQQEWLNTGSKWLVRRKTIVWIFQFVVITPFMDWYHKMSGRFIRRIL